jgi:hypothetical protein
MSSIVALRQPLTIEVSSFEEAVFKLMELNDEFQNLMLTIREEQHQLVLRRFRQGAIVQACCKTAPEKKMTETMDDLSDQTGISRAVLYQCRRFYLHEQWGQSESYLKQWLEEQEDSITWASIKSRVKTKEVNDPEYFVDKKRAIERMARRLEKETEQLQRESNDYEIGEGYLQTQGVVTKALQVASESVDSLYQVVDKTKPKRDPKYLRFIRANPCCVTRTSENIVAHHIVLSAKGRKGSDYATVPLANDIHLELHNIGVKTFQAKYEINFWEVVANMMGMYFTGQRMS